ncbi:mediator of DNA damage checkpoint protein 1 isoform X1 [Antechinus flavipes]|uniref:mediator of DNA damage checkpoint protein 1 isoform X1 n=1 Tax=Antechinus flavipes TaxID=38775 RepID=UPI0022365681|nr:mediator of DNA damage checkpoint protein 1 isoform X1 [Antechinus flavipes]XP_051852078.1 mediator of DNA damage checkpoint protein 1 isoform X1 [Antechinus flavipes]XP_051852079.1 mediator of DNA damage checkpoint protein 1 isoform X1 [Antechinus flavipes]
MEDTQLVDWEAQEEETEDSNGSPPHLGLEPVGRLHLFSSVRGPEKDFLLYPGENVVGRIPGCAVALPFPSISKHHAIIEIPAQGRAPILRDCGSLNHTRLLRPPKLLSPGVGHQLRDQDLVLFADLPCQYHRLGVPLLPGPRGALNVEETPRVPGTGGPQFQGTLLAEDSEEEGDSPLDRSIGVPVTYSPSETVVPESDVEGASPGCKGPALPLTFILDSDTDEEEDPLPMEPSSATRIASVVDKEWNRTGGENHLSAVGRDSDTDVERDESIMAIPSGAHVKESLPPDRDSDTDIDDEGSLQRISIVTPLIGTQPSSLEESGTDLEEEGLLVRPAKAHLEMDQHDKGDSDTDVEEDLISAAKLAIHQGKDQLLKGGTNNTDANEEGSPTELSTIHLNKDQHSIGRTGGNDTDGDDNGSLHMNSQLPDEENSRVEGAPVIDQLKRTTKKVGTQGRISITKVEHGLSPFPRDSSVGIVVEPSTQEKSAQVLLEGTQNNIERETDPDVDDIEDFQSKSDDNSDLDLQDTQCFVEGGNQNCGDGPDEPWEVLATQPFCSEQSEASGTLPTNSYIVDHRTCPTPSKTASNLQPDSPEKTELSISQDTNLNTEIPGQTMEGDMENQVIEIETPRITPERKVEKETFKRKTLANKAKRSKRKKVSPVVQTEISERGQRCKAGRGMQNVVTEKGIKSCGEIKVLDKEMERQTPEKDISEKQTPERRTKSPVVEVKVPKEMLEREVEGQMSEDYDQEVQNATPVMKSKVGEGNLQKLSLNPQISNDSRHHRGLNDDKILPLEEVPVDKQDFSNVPLVAPKVAVPEVSAPSSTPRITRSQNRRTFKPPHSSSPASQESPILATPRSRRQGILLASNIEPPLLEDSRDKSESSVQSQTQKPFSTSSALLTPELHPPIPEELPIIPDSHLQTRQNRKRGATGTCSSTSVTSFPEHSPSVPTERSETLVPPPRALRSQRAGAGESSESLTATPESSYSLTPEASVPRATRSRRVGARDTLGSTPEAQPKLSGRKRPPTTKEASPFSKQPRRGRSQRQESIKEEEDDKPVEVETAVKTPVKVAELAVHTKEIIKGIPGRSLRRARLNRELRAPKVLFTGVVDARGEQAVLALGGTLASSVAEASHLVTDRVRRTVKFLCALGRGIPILSLEWLHQSRKAGRFLAPDEFVVNDPEQENSFGFSLREALSRAQERGLLEGYEFYVTPGVQPPPPQMGEIITCCGGTVLSSMPRVYKPQRVVISCPQDLSRCSAAVRAKLPLLSPEFLLTGVLRQEAQLEAFLLSTSDPLPS